MKSLRFDLQNWQLGKYRPSLTQGFLSDSEQLYLTRVSGRSRSNYLKVLFLGDNHLRYHWEWKSSFISHLCRLQHPIFSWRYRAVHSCQCSVVRGMLVRCAPSWEGPWKGKRSRPTWLPILSRLHFMPPLQLTRELAKGCFPIDSYCQKLRRVLWSAPPNWHEKM